MGRSYPHRGSSKRGVPVGEPQAVAGHQRLSAVGLPWVTTRSSRPARTPAANTHCPIVCVHSRRWFRAESQRSAPLMDSQTDDECTCGFVTVGECLRNRDDVYTLPAVDSPQWIRFLVCSCLFGRTHTTHIMDEGLTALRRYDYASR